MLGYFPAPGTWIVAKFSGKEIIILVSKWMWGKKNQCKLEGARYISSLTLGQRDGQRTGWSVRSLRSADQLWELVRLQPEQVSICMFQDKNIKLRQPSLNFLTDKNPILLFKNITNF